MLLDLKFSIGTLGVGSGAFIAAVYGMNLKNFMEESQFGFLSVTGGTIIFAGFICVYGLMKLRKIQRVRMWSEGGRKGRSWRAESFDGLDGVRKERAERLKMLREEKAFAALEAEKQKEHLSVTVSDVQK